MAIKLLQNLLSLLLLKRLWLCAIVAVCINSSAISQITIDSIYVTGIAGNPTSYMTTAPSDAINDLTPNSGYTVRNGQGTNRNIRVDSFRLQMSSTDVFFTNFLVPDTVAIRRTDGSRFINIWYELIDDPLVSIDLYLGPDAVSDADELYKTRNLNAGYDNILVNNDDEGLGAIQAQTERVDIIWRTGIVTCQPDSAIFPVIDRGGNDEIKVAAITSLDANGDPDAYSDLVLIQDSDWPGHGNEYDNFLILRRQTVGEDPLPIANIGEYVDGQSKQAVQGVAVSFAQLGVTSGQVIYGYSIFASDVNTGSHDLTDISTFPNTTLASNSGLDLIAGITAAVSADNCLTPATGPGGFKESLATWLKANGVDRTGNNEVTSSASQGADVSDWQDHWVGNNDFSTSAGTKPTYNLSSSLVNFNPSVEFAGASLDLTNDPDDDFNGSQFYSKKGINIAIRTPSLTSGSPKQVIYEQGNGDKGINIYTSGTTLYVTAWNQTSDNGGIGAPWNTGTVSTISRSGIASDTEYIISFELDGNSTSTGTARAYLNGEQFGTLSNVGRLYEHGTGGVKLGSSDSGETLEFHDGQDAGTAYSFQGEIPEFIYCNEPGGFLLTQRRRIESYLAIKYGITLDQDPSPINYLNSEGAVIFNTTLTTAVGGYLTYNKDIAGIGRDDGSELSQLQSRSENNNSIVTMSRDTEFPKDNTFLIWGNDAADFDDNTTTNLPVNIGRRVDRVWRVAETGNAGLVDVSFDITGNTFTSTNFSLLIAGNSTNGNFSSAQIITGGLVVGNTITFSDVDFSNGQFFTLGTEFSTDCGPGGITTNLSLWLKADLGTSTTTDSADIATWTDLSGIGNNAIDDGLPPSYLGNYLNFNPVLDFKDNNEYLFGSNGGFYTQGYFMVVIPDNTLDNETLGQAPLGYYIGVDEEYAGAFYLGDAFAAITNGIPNPSTLPVVSHYIYEFGGSDFALEQNPTSSGPTRDIEANVPLIYNVNSSSPNIAISENGLILETESFIANYEETANSSFYLIGGNEFNDDHFDGKIAEVISYSSAPTPLEEIKIQSYLSIKYGITLTDDRDGDASAGETVTGSITEGDLVASDDGVIWDYSDKSSYHNNVAGIGRDDGSCFEQKQSKSVNSGSVVTMGIGGISTSNATNPNSFTADDSYLIWGADGTDPDDTPVDTQLPGTVTERMATIWRVQETGTVGNVSISFDLTGLTNYEGRNASQYQLIIASSGSTMPDLTGAATYSGGTFNGDVLTFDNVDFADGDYFTLGTARSSCSPGGVSVDLELWLRADEGTDGTTDGSTVSSWADQSANGFNASSQSLGGFAPVNPTFEVDEINFNPAVRIYDPSSTNSVYFQTSGSHTVTGNLSMIVAFKSGQFQGESNNFYLSPVFVSTGSSTVDTDYGLGMFNGRLFGNADNNNTFNAQSPASPLYNTLEPFIATLTREQAVSGAVEIYANSANVASGTSSTASLGGNTTFGIGNHPGSANDSTNAQLSGRVGEVIVFSHDLTATERQRVESYLAIKYGITRNVSALGASEQDYLASDGSTVFFDWDENTTYRNDIAGIGRDDGSCLTQTKSKSENNDAIVTMEISSFSTDDSFLMWANDNAAMENPDNREYNDAQVQSRLNREWRVQETGTVGSTTITFDVSDITGPTGIGTNNLNQIVMLVDADGDFKTGATIVNSTSIDAVNKTVTFTYNFTDGQFFTLGSPEEAALPIELIAFSASVLQNEVYLNWTTASEDNNSYFSIERSENGESFNTIAEIDGAGNSNSIRRYRYVDRYPVEGRSYYRLKQVDFNGDFSYSSVESVIIVARNEYSLVVAPNPVSKNETLRIEYQLPKNINYGNSSTISIYDLRGQLFLKENLKEEENSFITTVSNYAEGIYLVVLEASDGTKLTKRLVIRQ